jgi:CPA1 family monovalent cation:H+ antiporter
MERNVIRRTTLQLEEAEYDQLTQDGLIGPELRQQLLAGTAARRRALQARPDLDLALQKTELVRLFPLFETMSEAQRARLAAKLRTVYAAPGDVLMRRDERPRKVWFIASGAVETLQAGQRNRLGRGEMFGQLSVLLGKPRRAQVTAITHCTLLTLEDAVFLALVRSTPALAEAVRESAEKRGVKIDFEALAGTEAQGERRSRWPGFRSRRSRAS